MLIKGLRTRLTRALNVIRAGMPVKCYKTGLWKFWATLGKTVTDRQRAPKGSLQFCWLHSCWWSYWWKRNSRNSCLCGHCWRRPRLHPALWLLRSPGTGNNTDSRGNRSDHFQYRVFHRFATTLRLSLYFGLSRVPVLRWAEAPGSAWLPFLPRPLPDKVQKWCYSRQPPANFVFQLCPVGHFQIYENYLTN